MARTNLAVRPSVKNSATQWFGPSGWARIATGVHASLPRTTAFAGTTAGDLQIDRGDAIPGKWYVWSVSIRAISPQATVYANIDWYTGANTYVATSTGPSYNVTGATTTRIVSGVGLAPAGVGFGGCRPNLVGIDGSAQVTALLIEEYDSEAAANAALAAHASAAYYFDGDGDGVGNTGAAYAWTGTNGSSESTTTAGSVPTARIDFGALFMSGLGRREHGGESARVDFAPMRIATGVIVTAVYDGRRGRVRLKAVGLTSNVVRVIIYHRPAGTGRWTEVRGGRMAVVGGSLLRPVDDYEYRGGAVMQYRVVALASPENSPDDIVQTKILTVDNIPDVAWLKFIASPYLNRRIKIHDWSEVGRKSKNATYSVRGRIGPVQVTDVHDGRGMTVQLITHTIAEREALDGALSAGAPVLFQTPDSISCPTMYAVVGDYSWRSLSRLPGRERALFTVPLTEADPPPLSIVGVGFTWATVVAQYATWQELVDTVDSWQELMS
jgi:hypothetical protein